MRTKYVWLAMAAMLLLAGCGSNGGNGTSPSATNTQPAPPAGNQINIDGTLSISANGEDYRIECKSNIPNGAFVTIFIMDENENVFTEISDLKQKISAKEDEEVGKQQGKVVTTIKRENLAKYIQNNGSTQLVARLEFFPGNDVQPDSVVEVCGQNGELLTGNNVQDEELMGQKYIAMKSEPLTIE